MAENPKLPPELEARVREILDGPVSGRQEALNALSKEHPEHEKAIWALVNSALAAGTIGQALMKETSEPDCIGPYKILDVLGEGGMGTVYLAEQKEPVRRRVALKVIKLGMDTRQVLARFDAERQALALMEHDSIAKVHDAGATDNGRPYFVMEYVKGSPITHYCDTQRLTISERLALFSHVCAGVQHAHQKGVIHRDLKPSNVLVTVQGGKPVPKIIDFGLARATDHRLVESTIFTEQGQIIGTPEYMSPEQRGLVHSISTREATSTRSV